MKASEIIKQFRIIAFDKYEPYFTNDEEALLLLNEAMREAVTRGRLLLAVNDPEICFINIEAGVGDYALHPTVLEVIDAVIESESGYNKIRLSQASDTMVERLLGPNWQSAEGIPAYFVQNDTGFELFPKPVENWTMKIRCHHLPKKDLEMDDTPEIHLNHHSHLVDWIVYKAYSIPDTEFFDPNKSGIAKVNFDTYFGFGVDSDMKRDTRDDVPQVAVPFMP